MIQKIGRQYLVYILISVVIFFTLNELMGIKGTSRYIIATGYVYEQYLGGCNNAYLVEDSLEVGELELFYESVKGRPSGSHSINFMHKVIDKESETNILRYVAFDSSIIFIEAQGIYPFERVKGYTLRSLFYDKACRNE